MTRIGIYSGAFDPIHAGNLAFIETAVTHLKLDKVFLLVEPHPRHKQGVKALKHRQKMVELAIHNDPQLGQIILEKKHASIEDSLPELAARFSDAELYLLVHEDVFRHISAWPKIHDPIQQARLAIGLRADRHAALVDKLRTLERTRGINLNYDLFEALDVPAISKRVRSALRAGKIPKGIEPRVADYLREECLYSSSFIVK